MFCEAILWKSVNGKYGLRGGKYVVAMLIGPVVVSSVICNMSVSKSSFSLYFKLCFIKMAEPSCSSLLVFMICVV